jgi:hypothetical protein
LFARSTAINCWRTSGETKGGKRLIFFNARIREIASQSLSSRCRVFPVYLAVPLRRISQRSMPRSFNPDHQAELGESWNRAFWRRPGTKVSNPQNRPVQIGRNPPGLVEHRPLLTSGRGGTPRKRSNFLAPPAIRCATERLSNRPA